MQKIGPRGDASPVTPRFANGNLEYNYCNGNKSVKRQKSGVWFTQRYGIQWWWGTNGWWWGLGILGGILYFSDIKKSNTWSMQEVHKKGT